MSENIVKSSNQRLSVRVEALIEQMYEYRRPFIGIGFLIEVLAALRSSDVETTGRHADSRPAEIQGVAVKDGRAIVYGSPGYYGWLPEDDASQHNCDAMGCGQFHVLARIQVDRAAQKATAAPRESDWRCDHCGRDNDPAETHCGQCEWSRKHTIAGVLHERACMGSPCRCGALNGTTR